MEAAAAVTILGVAIAVIAIAVYLLAVIRVLRDIHAKLNIIISAVVRIITQTEPVAPVVGSINANLSKARNLLEGLLVSKLGAQGAAELVASVSPNGPSAAPARVAPAQAAPAPAPAPAPAAAPAPSASGRLAPTSRTFSGGGGGGGGAAPAAPEAPAAPGRVSARSPRPWER